MKGNVLIFLVVLLLAVSTVSAATYYNGIGDRLIRTFGPFYKQPLVRSDAQHQGWHQMGGDACDVQYGYCYSKSKGVHFFGGISQSALLDTCLFACCVFLVVVVLSVFCCVWMVCCTLFTACGSWCCVLDSSRVLPKVCCLLFVYCPLLQTPSPFPLCMCVCVGVGVTLCVCICLYVCVCDLMCVYLFICVCICLYMCVCVFAGGPTQAKPMVLCYTQAGQISAYGVYAFGEAPAPLVPKFWEPVSSGVYRTMMSLRNQSASCSSTSESSAPLGTRLSINQHFDIPLTQAEADRAGWLMGNCIPKMGIHYSYNIAPGASHSFALDTMLPTMPMYNPATGRVAAVLYLWDAPQQNGLIGPWEGPFDNNLFCLNWCKNSGCAFDGDTISSMHWLFGDYAHVSCKANATCVIGQ
jgi:hypothetical protein